MNRCDKTVKSLRYWVKKAFEGDPAGSKRFQLTRYWKVRYNQPVLISYMSGLATVLNELRSKLEEVNTPAELLDSVQPLAKELEEANNIQENSKGSRGSATQERVLRLNEIHSIARQFSDAAEFIYDENPARRELYRLPGNSQPSTDDEELVEEQVA